jgi:hypothetical protein
MIDYSESEPAQAELKRVVDQLNSGAFMIPVIGLVITDTNEFAVAHGLKYPPRAATLVPHSGFGWRKTRPSDDKCVYFAVSSAMTVDCLIFP